MRSTSRHLVAGRKRPLAIETGKRWPPAQLHATDGRCQGNERAAEASACRPAPNCHLVLSQTLQVVHGAVCDRTAPHGPEQPSLQPTHMLAALDLAIVCGDSE